MSNPIKVFVTGGTFDKEYNELNGNLFFKETHLHEMLDLGRSRLDLSITTLMMKDSLDFIEADRQIIATACQKCKEDKILITQDRKSTRLNSSHSQQSRMPSSA